MKKKCHYLVVDDDSTSNLICNYTIQRFDKEAKICLFTKPEPALEFIGENDCESGVTVLFLDVNMPGMSGFEFLTEFERFDSERKESYRIYMLTSSIEDFSSQAEDYKRVKGFLSKPMKVSYLEQIQKEVESDLASSAQKVEEPQKASD